MKTRMARRSGVAALAALTLIGIAACSPPAKTTGSASTGDAKAASATSATDVGGMAALVAGFQGLSTENQATTLGRGDSDTSAQRRTRARAGRQDLRGCDSTQIHESSLNPGRFTPHPNPGLDRSQGPL